MNGKFYQNSSHTELLNLQNKKSVDNWASKGKIIKEFDRPTKSYVFNLQNAGLSKMSVPKPKEKPIGIVEGYLVMQLYLFTHKSLSIEIGVTDVNKIKRRIVFSSSGKKIQRNLLHCRVPFPNLPLDNWINLSIDILSFYCGCFENTTFRAVDSIEFTFSGKVRKIISMKNPLFVEEDVANGLIDDNPVDFSTLPKNLQFPENLVFGNLNINIEKTCILFGIEEEFGKKPKIVEEPKEFKENVQAVRPKPVREVSEGRKLRMNFKVPVPRKKKLKEEVKEEVKKESKEQGKYSSIEVGKFEPDRKDTSMEIEEVFEAEKEVREEPKEEPKQTEEEEIWQMPIKNYFKEENNEEEMDKEKIKNDLLKTDAFEKSNLEENSRSYSPPCQKLVPMENLNSKIEDYNVEKEKSFLVEKEQTDMVYDHVIGCYFDPKTKVYYQLK